MRSLRCLATAVIVLSAYIAPLAVHGQCGSCTTSKTVSADATALLADSTNNFVGSCDMLSITSRASVQSMYCTNTLAMRNSEDLVYSRVISSTQLVGCVGMAAYNDYVQATRAHTGQVACNDPLSSVAGRSFLYDAASQQLLAASNPSSATLRFMRSCMDASSQNRRFPAFGFSVCDNGELCAQNAAYYAREQGDALSLYCTSTGPASGAPINFVNVPAAVTAVSDTSNELQFVLQNVSSCFGSAGPWYRIVDAKDTSKCVSYKKVTDVNQYLYYQMNLDGNCGDDSCASTAFGNTFALAMRKNFPCKVQCAKGYARNTSLVDATGLTLVNAVSLLSCPAGGSYPRPWTWLDDPCSNCDTGYSRVGSLCLDITPPTLSNVVMTSNRTNYPRFAGNGNRVTLTFTASEQLAATPTVTINTVAVTATSTGGLGYSASYTFVSSDPVPAEGSVVVFSVSFSDLAGNVGTPVTATSNTSVQVVYDSTPPTLSNVQFVSSGAQPTLAKFTDSVTLTFTASEPLEVLSLAVTIAGTAVSATNTGGNSFSATLVLATVTLSDGVIPFSIVFRDVAGNSGATVTTAASTVTYDTAMPPDAATLSCTPTLLQRSGVTTCTIIPYKAGNVTKSSADSFTVVASSLGALSGSITPVSGTSLSFTFQIAAQAPTGPANVTVTFPAGSAKGAVTVFVDPDSAVLSCEAASVAVGGTVRCNIQPLLSGAVVWAKASEFNVSVSPSAAATLTQAVAPQTGNALSFTLQGAVSQPTSVSVGKGNTVAVTVTDTPDSTSSLNCSATNVTTSQVVTCSVFLRRSGVAVWAPTASVTVTSTGNAVVGALTPTGAQSELSFAYTVASTAGTYTISLGGTTASFVVQAFADSCTPSPCFTGVTCTNTPGTGAGFVCGACPAGYTGDGKACDSPAQGTAVQGVLTVNTTVDLNNPTAVSNFTTAFINDVATALSVPTDRIQVVSLAQGSVIVTFRLLPPAPGTTGSLSTALYTNLQQQVSDPASSLRQGTVTSMATTLSTGSQLTVERCADGTWRNQGTCPGGSPPPAASSSGLSAAATAFVVIAAVLLVAFLAFFAKSYRDKQRHTTTVSNLKSPTAGGVELRAEGEPRSPTAGDNQKITFDSVVAGKVQPRLSQIDHPTMP